MYSYTIQVTEHITVFFVCACLTRGWGGDYNKQRFLRCMHTTVAQPVGRGVRGEGTSSLVIIVVIASSRTVERGGPLAAAVVWASGLL